MANIRSGLDAVIDIRQLLRFGQGTITPLLGVVVSLAGATQALADAEVASEQGANGLRYFNDELQYSTTSYSTVTPVGTENPSEEGWYVMEGAAFVLTEDTTVVSGTTYYQRVITWHTISSGGGGGSADVEERLDNAEQNILALALTFSIQQEAAVNGTADNIAVEVFDDTSGFIIVSGMYDSTNHRVYA